MRDRTIIWRRVTVVALVAVALAPSASLAGASSSWQPTLVRQSAVATLSTRDVGTFSVALSVGGANGDGISADISVFPALHTRSDLAPILSGTGAQGLPLSSTGSFRLDCRSSGVATVLLTVAGAPAVPKTSCGAQPFLNIRCRHTACLGVYPLAISMTNNQVTRTIWSLLSVTSAAPSSPVGVAWILQSNPSSHTTTQREANALRVVAANNGTTATVAVDYRGMDHVFFSTTPTAAAYRTAFAAALAVARHGLINGPPPSIDFSVLATHHLASDVIAQSHLATNLASRLVNKNPGLALVLTGSITPADLRALDKARVHFVVVPDTSLVQPPSATLHWGTPFRFGGAPLDLIGVATDTPLRDLALNDGIAPGLRAVLTVGELNLLHFEAPYAVGPRVAVVELPLARVGSAYLSALWSTLRHDPLVHTAAVGGLFHLSDVGDNGYPTFESLRAVHPASWSVDNLETTATLDLTLQSFGQSVLNSLAPATPLKVQILSAERTQNSGQRQRQLNAVRASLQNQLNSFRIDSTTISLAGNGTPLPVTLTSQARYTVIGYLSLSAPNVFFPEGKVIPFTLNATTNSVRVPADIHGSGNFTLIVRFVSEDRRLVIALGAIQVRSATNATVGYLLTIGALLVIALWWVRTLRRRPKARHAR